jgi:hypothetical protein
MPDAPVDEVVQTPEAPAAEPVPTGPGPKDAIVLVSKIRGAR